MTRRSKLSHVLRTCLSSGAVAGLALALPLVGAAPASAAQARRVGSAPRIPAGARALGAVPGTQTVAATVALTPRDPAGLAAYVQAVSTPGSPLYHHFLSVSQFSQRFGASTGQADAVRSSLAAGGLTVGRLSPNHLSLAVSAPAATMAGAFSTGLERYRLRSGRTGFANTSAPAVASSVGSLVQGVVGLDTLATPAPQGLRAGHLMRSRAAAGSHSVSGPGAQPCTAATQDGTSYAGYTADQIASAYGLSQLYAQGDLGAGTTIALYELEPYRASDISTYQSCYGTSAQVTNVRVDGGAGNGGGSGEAALDIENVIGLAPQATIQVYEGPDTTAGGLDTYQQIVSDDSAQVISTSWGMCEADLMGSNDGTVENTLFEEAAAQGQSIFAATGDNGADDCDTNGPQSVDDPASQPNVTAVGGTSLAGASPSATETVWNDGTGGGSGGGGVSSVWAAPSYQSGYSISQTSTSCGTGGYACRQVPDVSADADQYHGYVIYYNRHWTAYGGTSAAAPTWAALTALADALPSCTPAGGRLGLVNPALYTAAGVGYSSDFKDVTAGNNTYDGVVGFPAGTGYDMASGLGTPIAPSLAPALCGDLVTLTPPAAQTAVTGTSQALQLVATSSAGTAVTWQASGLPPGLTLSASTGQISGTPTTAGTYAVRAVATDASGSAGDASFSWTVAAPSPAQNDATTDTTSGSSGSSGDTTTTGTATAETATTPMSPATTTTPASTDPAPTDPAPTDPAPTDPAQTDPAPTDPAPIDPAPTTTVTSAPPLASAPAAPPVLTAPALSPTAPAGNSPAPASVRISRSLKLDRHGHPILSVSVTAARTRTAIRQITVSIPARLARFSAAAVRRGTAVAVRDSSGRRLAATVVLRHGALTITFRHAPRTANLRVTAPALTVAKVASSASVTRATVRVTVKTTV